jgi:hypothetical protein
VSTPVWRTVTMRFAALVGAVSPRTNPTPA